MNELLTPRELGYRMPAEWEPHQSTWLSWPHNAQCWPGKIETIWPRYAEMAVAISRSETVHINVVDEEMRRQAEHFLERAGARGEIMLHLFPTNDAWCRDHGAIFIVSDSPDAPAPAPVAATHWGYNAWGGKYPRYERDVQIPRLMAEALGVPRFEAGMILEGGSIDVNGEGLLLTTESCLLNPNRNPHLSREQIEQRLRDFLGVEAIYWLGDGIVGDDTDGHVDDLTRFVGPRTIVTAVEADPEDVNYRALSENLRRLKEMRTPDGQPFEIVELPMPRPVVYQGNRLPASYANFYIANTSIILPVFGCDRDDAAREIVGSLFPDREIVGIDCTDIVWGLGACHCLTQQVPRG